MPPTALEAKAETTPVREYTPEDFLVMPEGKHYELIDGKLVERHMGAEAGQVAANVIHILANYIRPQKLGWLFTSDCGYQIFSESRNRVRKPDVSFISRGRLPNERIPRGFLRIPPDLAVEVVSPTDTAEEVETKRIEFLEAGTRLVWIVYPETRTVHVSQPAGASAMLRATDDLTGADVLPGFQCRVADFFETP